MVEGTIVAKCPDSARTVPTFLILSGQSILAVKYYKYPDFSWKVIASQLIFLEGLVDSSQFPVEVLHCTCGVNSGRFRSCLWSC